MTMSVSSNKGELDVPDGTRLKVGVVGLGLMGSALADALIAKGFDVTVWNRTLAKARRFAEAGVTVAPNVVDAARGADVLIVCLLDHEATMATVALESVANALRGKTLIQLTTTTAAESRALGAWAEAHSIAYLEGQILHYPDDIRAGRATIPCAGPRSVHARCAAVLDALAAKSPLLSENLGAAAIFDKALFEVEFPAYMGFLHGAAMCRAIGVPIATYTDLMAETCFASGMVERFARDFGSRAAAGNYANDVKATLDTYGSAFAKTIRESEALGIEARHLTGVAELLRRSIDAGHGSHEFAAVFELFCRR